MNTGPGRKGFAIKIRRKDGSSFFTASAEGIHTPVWIQRKQAVKYKRMLRSEGFNARVVKVIFTDPVEVSI